MTVLGIAACGDGLPREADRELTPAGRSYAEARIARIDSTATRISKEMWLGRGALSTHPAFTRTASTHMPPNIGFARRIAPASRSTASAGRVTDATVERFRAELTSAGGAEADDERVLAYVDTLNTRVASLNRGLSDVRGELRTLYAEGRTREATLLIRRRIAETFLVVDPGAVETADTTLSSDRRRALHHAYFITYLNRLGAAEAASDPGGRR